MVGLRVGVLQTYRSTGSKSTVSSRVHYVGTCFNSSTNWTATGPPEMGRLIDKHEHTKLSESEAPKV